MQTGMHARGALIPPEGQRSGLERPQDSVIGSRKTVRTVRDEDESGAKARIPQALAVGVCQYSLVYQRRINGKIVQKYVGYLGKDPKSRVEISYGEIMPYVSRLMDLEISNAEMHEILKKIGIDTDISPIAKIVIENDQKLKKTILMIK
jgi:hypothetical protein